MRAGEALGWEISHPQFPAPTPKSVGPRGIGVGAGGSVIDPPLNCKSGDDPPTFRLNYVYKLFDNR